MAILSMMLYGSCARGDNKSDSDVDLLALYDEPTYKMSAQNKLNIVYYNKEFLGKRMIEGNLFCLHLLKEGKIIYDTGNTLANILNQFSYKNEYHTEIKEASELGWVLIKFSNDFDNYFYLNKKIAWCIRTIIIAKSAQDQKPVFSKDAMKSYLNDSSFLPIIDAKGNSNFSKDNIKLMSNFLSKWGTERPKWLENIKSLNEANKYFKENSYANYVTKAFKISSYM
jgi:hypothetical protein